ncbi:MAG: acyl-CoA desaturase [Acidimicrobiales bacterium]
MLPSPVRGPDEQVAWRSSLPFIACHFIPLAAFWTGVTTTSVVLLVALYLTRVFFITAGYHRYFAHRAYRLGRIPQLVMAFGGLTAVQKGPLWWAGNHRDHHKYADTERDPHTPQKGFWWSHIGWVLSGKYSASDHRKIEDFAAYPELRFLDRHDWIGPWALGTLCLLIDGWSGLVVGFFGSTVLVWHATFSVNSLSHIFGRRRYGTADTSRNNVLVAVLTMGEGWHNNHHHYPASARQGFHWWEIDVTYLVLRVLSVAGIARDLRQPPAAARSARRLRAGHFDLGLFRQHLARAAATIPRPESGGVSDDSADDLVARLTELARHPNLQ